MKAKDVAMMVVQRPEWGIRDVEKMIPEYSNALPRRAWIKLSLARCLPPCKGGSTS